MKTSLVDSLLPAPYGRHASLCGIAHGRSRFIGVRSSATYDNGVQSLASSLVLHKRLEAAQRLVPLLCDDVNVPAGVFQAPSLQLPNAFPSVTMAPYESGIF